MKISIESILKEIEISSEKILSNPNEYKRQLASTIYFVGNENLNHWSISKEIACYKFNVSKVTDGKIFFYDNGFINALDLEDVATKQYAINSFLTWAKSFELNVNIVSKFNKDQNGNNKIQLLVPYEILEQNQFNEIRISSDKYSNKNEGQEKFLKEYKYNFRNKKLVLDAKQKWKTDCWVCGFNFTDIYGDLGNDFIEIHHLIPIREGERESDIEDVRPLCSNCHRMIHKGDKMLSIQELKNIIEEVGNNKAGT